MGATTTPTLTPLMQQYWDLKNSEKCKGALLFFRMGDFYELFGSDAEEAHALLGITLTSREKSADAPKMAGVPHHSAESYLERLLNAGRKVAIAEQMEAPDTKEGKGPVRREIVRVLTPGIRLGLEAGEGIYTARFAMNRAFAAIDSGTGDAVIDAELDPREVLGVVTQLNVKHLLIDSLDLIPTEALALLRDLKILVEVMPSMEFNPKLDTLVAELVKYLLQNQSVPSAAHLKPARSLKGDRVLRLSPAALQHLDVIPGFSPLNVFDSLRKTRTAMGARLFRRWSSAPLAEPAAIKVRQSFVLELSKPEPLSAIPKLLSEIYDLERLSGRIALRVATLEDLRALRVSLQTAANVGSHGAVGKHVKVTKTLRDATALLESALSVDPASPSSGQTTFAHGYDPELDRALDLTERGAEHLLTLEAAERTRTGITTLKVKYHRSFGYFYEVSKSHLTKVPSDYVRRQSMVGAERFSNEALETLATELLSAETQKREREKILFSQLLDQLTESVPALMALSEQIATLDVLLSLASLLQRPGWKMPEIDGGNEFRFEDSRHPLLADSGQFVPNSLELNGQKRGLLITGPNMGGKSTLMRQIGLSVILGQMGAPIPASRAQWGVITSLHTRIGAHDSLERGQSTFMVEMTELSTILASAHDRSLVILDEIGRGTSTFDGLSVAWATLEWLVGETRAKVLCSTHYHELTELAQHQPALVNAHVTVEETQGQLRFLYKLAEGPASESFGIHVAKLAGLPDSVVARAWQILERLEKPAAQPKTPGLRVYRASPDQLSLFKQKQQF